MILDTFKNINSTLPVVKIKHNEKDYFFMIDTGCNISVLDKCAITDDFLLYETDLKTHKITTANGSQDTENPVVAMCFNIGPKKYMDYFNILDMHEAFEDIKEEYGVRMTGLIGNKFLTEQNLILDFESQTIQYEDKQKDSSGV